MEPEAQRGSSLAKIGLLRRLRFNGAKAWLSAPEVPRSEIVSPFETFYASPVS